MQVFCRIVELGTFVAVARERGVSAMMVSKYIKQLETSLGVTLIYRQSRTLQVTEVGLIYYNRCKVILDDVDTLECAISQSGQEVKGELRLNVSIDFGSLYMLPIIHRYQQQYPDVNILMSLDNTPIKLAESHFDIAIVVTDTLDQGVVARKIAQTSLGTYASPDYLSQCGEPKNLSEIEGHRCLHYLGTPHANVWVFNHVGQRVEITPQWVFASNNGKTLCQAAALGMGIVRTPALSVKPYVESGELVEILADYRMSDLAVYATYLQRDCYPPKTKTFIDFLMDYFAEK